MTRAELAAVLVWVPDVLIVTFWACAAFVWPGFVALAWIARHRGPNE